MKISKFNKINRKRIVGLLPRNLKRYYKGDKISVYTVGTGKDGTMIYAADSYYRYRTELIFLVSSELSGSFAVEVYDSALEAEIGHEKWIAITKNSETTYTLTGGEHLSVNIPEDIHA